MTLNRPDPLLPAMTGRVRADVYYIFIETTQYAIISMKQKYELDETSSSNGM